MKEEAELEQEEEDEAERRRAATLKPLPSTSMLPQGAHSAAQRRSASLLSGTERPDSGFDSKDEGASAATPTKDPPPSSANLSLPPNPDLNLPPSNPPFVAAERP